MRLSTAPPLIACCALALAGCGGHDAGSRVLVVGWDGATFDLLDPMVSEGELPHLAALMARGRSAALESTRIPISSAAWPTITTGVEPGEHGIYSFFQTEEESYDVRLVSAIDVAAPPIWRVLSGRGHRSHVWGVPMTYPPERIDGTMVAGMLSPFGAEYAHPPGLTNELRSKGFVPDVGVWRQNQVADFAQIERQLDIKERELLDLVGRGDWRLCMFVFKSLDVLCHRPNLDLRGPEIRRLLRRLDVILGRLVAAAGPDATVLLLSDHGFQTYRRSFNLHRWLVDAGWSVQREGGAPGASPVGPLADAKASQRAARLATLDLDASRAIADVAEGNYGAIRLNIAGREPTGPLPREERSAALSELEALLGQVEFPAGVPVVRAMYRGADLYPGPLQDARVPDLIVEFDPAWRVYTDLFGPPMSVGTQPFPDHALDGVLVVAGPTIEADEGRARAALTDVAPILYHLMGEPLPARLKGDPHPSIERRPREVRRLEAERDPGMRVLEGDFGNPDEAGEQEVTDRIQSIGYGG
ncbi:MAG: alkaline phosphatase family protein [Planctomycetota bacterium]|nr:alkaline phosphatase family protein [Planctomycetota bacterium]